MKELLGIIATFISVSLSLAQGNPNPSTTLDAAIQAEMNTEKFPGVSTVIVKNGEIVWVESYGLADVENNIFVEDTTVFLLASLSKVFTGTAVMQLYESGAINLDEDINNHLGFAIDIPGFMADSITFRQLMTHTASINDNGPVMDTYYDYPDPSISLANCILNYFSTTGTDYDAAANFFNNAPGTAYNYSNMGTALDGYLVEAVTGKLFNEFCDSSIFDPLCMTKTSWFISDFDTNHVARPHQYVAGNYEAYNHYGFADYPDGQLRSNVFDLANFMIAYLDGGAFGSNNVLSSASINEMFTPQISGLEPTQGLNWYQEEIFYNAGASSNMLWGHNGGEDGVSTDMYLDPVNGIGICVLTNGEGDALFICDELYDYAMSLTPTASIVPACSVVSIEEEENTEWIVYPNPANNELFLSAEHVLSNAQVKLMDIQGRLIQQFAFSGQSATVDVSTFAPGVYLLNIQSDKGIKEVKVIVE